MMGFDLAAYIHTRKAQWEAETINAKRLPLWDSGKTPFLVENCEQAEPTLIPYLIEGNAARGAVIVSAGGSYGWKEPLEAFSHAKWLNEIGLHAFILDYRVTPYTTKHALLDIQRAVRILRYHSHRYHIRRDKIACMGFSAGGHLSGMLSEWFDTGDSHAGDPVEQVSCRPNGQILCYPGITFHTYEHDFLKKVLGESYTDQDIAHTSLHLNARSDAPPIFFWGTQNDFLFKDWLLFLSAMHEKKVPIAVHIFPGGEHGFGREREHFIWKQWSSLCETWLKENHFID